MKKIEQRLTKLEGLRDSLNKKVVIRYRSDNDPPFTKQPRNVDSYLVTFVTPEIMCQYLGE